MSVYADDGYGAGPTMVNPIKGIGLDTPQVTGAIVLGALAMLILIRRGFRGVNLAGVRVGVS